MKRLLPKRLNVEYISLSFFPVSERELARFLSERSASVSAGIVPKPRLLQSIVLFHFLLIYQNEISLIVKCRLQFPLLRSLMRGS